MWKKRTHKEFAYFWVNEKKGLKAALNTGGKFMLWSEKGSCDTVQCDSVGDALALMDKVVSRSAFGVEIENE